MRKLFILLGLTLSFSLSANINNNVDDIVNGDIETGINNHENDNSVLNQNLESELFNLIVTDCKFHKVVKEDFLPLEVVLDEIDIDIVNIQYEEELEVAAKAVSILEQDIVLEEIELDLENSRYEEELSSVN